MRGALLIAAAMVKVASAEPLISWRAPVGCSNENEIRGAIQARAQRPRGVAPYAVATVTADGDELVATILLHTKNGLDQREVRGASCDGLADAVAWVIALAWLPDAAPVVVEAPVVEAPPAEPPAPPWLHPRAAVRTAFDAGTLPSGDAGVGLAVGAGIGDDWAVEAAATWWAPRFSATMDDGAGGVEVGLVAASGQLCWRFACVGGEAGRMTGRPVGLGDGREAELTWVAATAGGRWRYAVSERLELVVDAGLALAIARPQFQLSDGTEAFRPAPVAARLGVALAFR